MCVSSTAAAQTVKSTVTLRNQQYRGAKLTSLVNGKRASSSWSYGVVRAGDKLEHEFALRNDSGLTIVVDRIQSSCACTSAVIGARASRSVPAGGDVRIHVTLDTARVPSGSRPALLSGSHSSQRIWVYVKGDSVHAAALLELTGTISTGVAFDPPNIDFGHVSSKARAFKLVRVSFDRSLFSIDQTGLQAQPGSSIRILPAQPLNTNSPRAKSTPRQVVRYYRIEMQPGSPAGILSGTISVVGLLSQALKQPSSASVTAFTLPYTGEVDTIVQAVPSTVAFGIVRPTKSPRIISLNADEIQRRTRWILLRKRAIVATSRNNEPINWYKARVIVNSESFHAALFTPAALRSSKQFREPAVGSGLPGSLPEGLSEQGACWLQITLLPDAPRGKPLEAQAEVWLEGGERLRLPIVAL